MHAIGACCGAGRARTVPGLRGACGPECTRGLGTLRLGSRWRSGLRRIRLPQEGSPTRGQSHGYQGSQGRPAKPAGGTHRIAKVELDDLVVVLVSHTLATIVVIAAERLLHIAAP